MATTEATQRTVTLQINARVVNTYTTEGVTSKLIGTGTLTYPTEIHGWDDTDTFTVTGRVKRQIDAQTLEVEILKIQTHDLVGTVVDEVVAES